MLKVFKLYVLQNNDNLTKLDNDLDESPTVMVGNPKNRTTTRQK
jgi:hypothetical protein